MPGSWRFILEKRDDLNAGGTIPGFRTMERALAVGERWLADQADPSAWRLTVDWVEDDQPATLSVTGN